MRAPISTTDDLMEIDLGAFADPDAQVILLDRASGGDASVRDAIKAEIGREQDRGWCRILHMSDEIAVVRWHDQFVLSLTEKGMALASPVDGGLP